MKTKTDFNAKLANVNIKITSNKTKHLLVGNELKKLETFGSIYFRGKSHSDDDGTQNYLVSQTGYRFLKMASIKDTNILSWKSKRLHDECIKPPSTSNKMLNFSLGYVGTKARVKFNGNCLKQVKIHLILEI